MVEAGGERETKGSHKIDKHCTHFHGLRLGWGGWKWAGKDDGEEKAKARFFNVMGFHEPGRVNSFRSEGELPCWRKKSMA
jgi:hypothetical protein